MNLYFVVEGRRSERKLYPKWIGYAVPFLNQIDKPEQANENCFYLISGGGFPSILKAVSDAIETINILECHYDCLVVVVDSEEESIEVRNKEIVNCVLRTPLQKETKIVTIVQHRCLETWLLGNRRMCSRQPQAVEYVKCFRFYNVLDNDPEEMGKPTSYAGTTADFHWYYLKRVFEHRNVSYSKKQPGDAAKEQYWIELRNRYYETSHLESFGVLCRFFDDINEMP